MPAGYTPAAAAAAAGNNLDQTHDSRALSIPQKQQQQDGHGINTVADGGDGGERPRSAHRKSANDSGWDKDQQRALYMGVDLSTPRDAHGNTTKIPVFDCIRACVYVCVCVCLCLRMRVLLSFCLAA
jgi:hypothetical protein